MSDSDIIKIPEMAKRLEMTEAALRGHIQRRTDAIPPFFHLGTRVVWRRATVAAWLEKKEQEEQRDRVARPTRRRLGGSRS